MATTPFDLTTEQKNLLKSLSQETGKPISALIEDALNGLQERVCLIHSRANGNQVVNMEAPASSSDQPRKPIWELFEEASHTMPDEELDRLPTDGSYQHDHYLYGTPKRPT
jgi:predicted DNA-binding protein